MRCAQETREREDHWPTPEGPVVAAQLLPFQTARRFADGPSGTENVRPTAMQAVRDEQNTLLREPRLAELPEIHTDFQAWPSQRCAAAAAALWPTAMQKAVPIQDTPWRKLVPAARWAAHLSVKKESEKGRPPPDGAPTVSIAFPTATQPILATQETSVKYGLAKPCGTPTTSTRQEAALASAGAALKVRRSATAAMRDHCRRRLAKRRLRMRDASNFCGLCSDWRSVVWASV